MNNSNKIYISCFASNEIIRVDALTGTIEARTHSDNYPYAIIVDDTKVYSTVFWSTTPSYVKTLNNKAHGFYVTDPDKIPRNALVNTNSVTIAGLDADTPASIPNIFGATLFKNGINVGQTTTVVNGDSLYIQFTSPTTPETNVEIPLFVGTQYDWFVSKTAPVDNIIDPYYFVDIFDCQTNTDYTSNEVQITGIDWDVTLPFTTNYGSIILNGVNTNSQSVTVKNNDKIKIFAKSDTSYCAEKFVTTSCGSYTNIWTIGTQDNTQSTDIINSIVIPDKTGALLNTLYDSDEQTITGQFTQPITVHLEPYQDATIIKNGVDVGIVTTFVVGDKFKIRARSLNYNKKPMTIGLYCCKFKTTFTIFTSADIIPDIMIFDAYVDAIPKSSITSHQLPITGITENESIDIEVYAVDVTDKLNSLLQTKLIVNGVTLSTNKATVKLGDTIGISSLVLGTPWNGSKLSFNIKTSNFVFGYFDVYTAYLEGSVHAINLATHSSRQVSFDTTPTYSRMESNPLTPVVDYSSIQQLSYDKTSPELYNQESIKLAYLDDVYQEYKTYDQVTTTTTIIIPGTTTIVPVKIDPYWNYVSLLISDDSKSSSVVTTPDTTQTITETKLVEVINKLYTRLDNATPVSVLVPLSEYSATYSVKPKITDTTFSYSSSISNNIQIAASSIQYSSDRANSLFLIDSANTFSAKKSNAIAYSSQAVYTQQNYTSYSVSLNDYERIGDHGKFTIATSYDSLLPYAMVISDAVEYASSEYPNVNEILLDYYRFESSHYCDLINYFHDISTPFKLSYDGIDFSSQILTYSLHTIDSEYVVSYSISNGDIESVYEIRDQLAYSNEIYAEYLNVKNVSSSTYLAEFIINDAKTNKIDVDSLYFTDKTTGKSLISSVYDYGTNVSSNELSATYLIDITTSSNLVSSVYSTDKTTGKNYVSSVYSTDKTTGKNLVSPSYYSSTKDIAKYFVNANYFVGASYSNKAVTPSYGKTYSEDAAKLVDAQYLADNPVVHQKLGESRITQPVYPCLAKFVDTNWIVYPELEKYAETGLYIHRDATFGIVYLENFVKNVPTVVDAKLRTFADVSGRTQVFNNVYAELQSISKCILVGQIPEPITQHYSGKIISLEHIVQHLSQNEINVEPLVQEKTQKVVDVFPLSQQITAYVISLDVTKQSFAKYSVDTYPVVQNVFRSIVEQQVDVVSLPKCVVDTSPSVSSLGKYEISTYPLHQVFSQKYVELNIDVNSILKGVVELIPTIQHIAPKLVDSHVIVQPISKNEIGTYYASQALSKELIDIQSSVQAISKHSINVDYDVSLIPQKQIDSQFVVQTLSKYAIDSSIITQALSKHNIDVAYSLQVLSKHSINVDYDVHSLPERQVDTYYFSQPIPQKVIDSQSIVQALSKYDIDVEYALQSVNKINITPEFGVEYHSHIVIDIANVVQASNQRYIDTQYVKQINDKHLIQIQNIIKSVSGIYSEPSVIVSPIEKRIVGVTYLANTTPSKIISAVATIDVIPEREITFDSVIVQSIPQRLVGGTQYQFYTKAEGILEPIVQSLSKSEIVISDYIEQVNSTQVCSYAGVIKQSVSYSVVYEQYVAYQHTSSISNYENIVVRNTSRVYSDFVTYESNGFVGKVAEQLAIKQAIQQKQSDVISSSIQYQHISGKVVDLGYFITSISGEKYSDLGHAYIQSISDKIVELPSFIVQSVSNKVTEGSSAFIQIMSDKIAQLPYFDAQFISGKLTDLPSAILQDIPSNIAELSNAILQKIATKITDLPSAILQDIPSNIAELPNAVVQSIPSNIAELPSAIIQAIPDKVAELPNFNLQAISGKFTDLPSAILQSVSENIVQLPRADIQVISSKTALLPDAIVQSISDKVVELSNFVVSSTLDKAIDAVPFITQSSSQKVVESKQFISQATDKTIVSGAVATINSISKCVVSPEVVVANTSGKSTSVEYTVRSTTAFTISPNVVYLPTAQKVTERSASVQSKSSIVATIIPIVTSISRVNVDAGVITQSTSKQSIEITPEVYNKSGNVVELNCVTRTESRIVNTISFIKSDTNTIVKQCEYEVRTLVGYDSNILTTEEKRTFATAEEAVQSAINEGYENPIAYKLPDGTYFWYVASLIDSKHCSVGPTKVYPVSWYIQGG